MLACKADGVEEAHFPGDPFGTDNTTNWGVYGADLRYTWDIHNSGGPGNVYAYILGLHTDPDPKKTAYYGAARVTLWSTSAQKGVPPLHYYAADDPVITNLAHLTEDGPLVIASGATHTLEIELANGGSATMPFLLMLSKTQLDAHPVG